MCSRNTLQAVLEGILIGAAGLIPGASGGIMAVAFGVYQEALDAIIGLFSNFKKSFSFLWPYGLGVAIGVFGCAFALEWLLKNWNMPFMYMLIGMVLGGIPSIIKEAGKPFSLKYAVCSLLGAVLVAAIALLDDRLTGSETWEYNYLTAALAGGIISIGIVIPGISTSFILIVRAAALLPHQAGNTLSHMRGMQRAHSRRAVGGICTQYVPQAPRRCELLCAGLPHRHHGAYLPRLRAVFQGAFISRPRRDRLLPYHPAEQAGRMTLPLNINTLIGG